MEIHAGYITLFVFVGIFLTWVLIMIIGGVEFGIRHCLRVKKRREQEELARAGGHVAHFTICNV